MADRHGEDDHSVYVSLTLENAFEKTKTKVTEIDRVVYPFLTADQETRLFEAASGETRVMRSKEEAHDYRYFAEPDLGTLEVSPEWIAEVRATLRETPREKRRRFLTVYALSAADADLLSSARPLAEYFETVAAIVAPRLAASWVSGEVLRWMKEQRLSPEEAGQFSVSPAQLGELIGFVGSGAISHSAAKTVFEEMLAAYLRGLVVPLQERSTT